jgi:hypothetical protein
MAPPIDEGAPDAAWHGPSKPTKPIVIYLCHHLLYIYR